MRISNGVDFHLIHSHYVYCAFKRGVDNRNTHDFSLLFQVGNILGYRESLLFEVETKKS